MSDKDDDTTNDAVAATTSLEKVDGSNTGKEQEDNNAKTPFKFNVHAATFVPSEYVAYSSTTSDDAYSSNRIENNAEAAAGSVGEMMTTKKKKKNNRKKQNSKRMVDEEQQYVYGYYEGGGEVAAFNPYVPVDFAGNPMVYYLPVPYPMYDPMYGGVMYYTDEEEMGYEEQEYNIEVIDPSTSSSATLSLSPSAAIPIKPALSKSQQKKLRAKQKKAESVAAATGAETAITTSTTIALNVNATTSPEDAAASTKIEPDDCNNNSNSDGKKKTKSKNKRRSNVNNVPKKEIESKNESKPTPVTVVSSKTGTMNTPQTDSISYANALKLKPPAPSPAPKNNSGNASKSVINNNNKTTKAMNSAENNTSINKNANAVANGNPVANGKSSGSIGGKSNNNNNSTQKNESVVANAIIETLAPPTKTYASVSRSSATVSKTTSKPITKPILPKSSTPTLTTSTTKATKSSSRSAAAASGSNSWTSKLSQTPAIPSSKNTKGVMKASAKRASTVVSSSVNVKVKNVGSNRNNVNSSSNTSTTTIITIQKPHKPTIVDLASFIEARLKNVSAPQPQLSLAPKRLKPNTRKEPPLKRGKQREVKKPKKPSKLKQLIRFSHELESRFPFTITPATASNVIAAAEKPPEKPLSKAQKRRLRKKLLLNNSSNNKNIIVSNHVKLVLDRSPELAKSQELPREYCTQVMSRKLDKTIATLLTNLLRFQNRAKERNLMSAKQKRRVIMGLSEVNRALKLKKVKALLIAKNIEHVSLSGGLDDIVGSMMDCCYDNGIPVIFSMKRKKLGSVVKKDMPISVIAILSADGAEALYKEVLSLAESLREDWKKQFCSNPNYRNTNGETPLWIASYFGYEECLDALLLQRNLRLTNNKNNSSNDKNNNSIVTNNSNNKINIVTNKRKHVGGNYNSFFDASTTSATVTFNDGIAGGADDNWNEATDDLEMDSNVNDRDINFEETKHRDDGAPIDINMSNLDEVTPLMAAAANNHYRIVVKLIANGADPNLVDNRGYTVLHYAYWYHRKNIVQYLKPLVSQELTQAILLTQNPLFTLESLAAAKKQATIATAISDEDNATRIPPPLLALPPPLIPKLPSAKLPAKNDDGKKVHHDSDDSIEQHCDHDSVAQTVTKTNHGEESTIVQ